jgi:hypothetical protein
MCVFRRERRRQYSRDSADALNPRKTLAAPAKERKGEVYPVATETGPRMRTSTARRAEVRRPIETKPFFLTSEFGVLAIFTVCLFIASAVLEDVDSRLAWILGTGLVGAYMLSRGIAKSGTKSRSYDPREDMEIFGGASTDSPGDARTRS